MDKHFFPPVYFQQEQLYSISLDSGGTEIVGPRDSVKFVFAMIACRGNLNFFLK